MSLGEKAQGPGGPTGVKVLAELIESAVENQPT